MNKVSKPSRMNGGTIEWHLNNLIHREDGPAVECVNGDKHWYVNGLRHREDGPAVELANGNKYWYVNGKLHRVDGPAIEKSNGDKWWYMGKQVTEEYFLSDEFKIRVVMDE